jgi:hypothetical protein
MKWTGSDFLLFVRCCKQQVLAWHPDALAEQKETFPTLRAAAGRLEWHAALAPQRMPWVLGQTVLPSISWMTLLRLLAWKLTPSLFDRLATSLMLPRVVDATLFELFKLRAPMLTSILSLSCKPAPASVTTLLLGLSSRLEPVTAMLWFLELATIRGVID